MALRLSLCRDQTKSNDGSAHFYCSLQLHTVVRCTRAWMIDDVVTPTAVITMSRSRHVAISQRKAFAKLKNRILGRLARDPAAAVATRDIAVRRIPTRQAVLT